MLLAPIGRIGMAQAMAMPARAGAAMAHCAEMPPRMAGHHQKAPEQGEKVATDCMIACAAMAPPPATFVAPMPAAMALRAASSLASLVGIHPESDPPPPRPS